MKRTYLLLTTMLLAIFLTACGVDEFRIECDGFFITSVTEDLGDVGGAPFALPLTATIRIEDSIGTTLFNGTLFTISEAGIFSTNGGFHPYSQRPRVQPLTVTLTAPGLGEEVLDMIFVECTALPDDSPIIYFTDDRIGPDTATSLNAFHQDDGIVIYSQENGSFLISFEAIDALGNPSSNTLLASHNGIDVYLLSDGLIQIMETTAEDGKRDILIIDIDEDGIVRRWRRGTFNTLTGETNIYLQSDGWDGYPRNF